MLRSWLIEQGQPPNVLPLHSAVNSFLIHSSGEQKYLLFLQGIENIKNEIEDATEPLIDPVYGHGR